MDKKRYKFKIHLSMPSTRSNEVIIACGYNIENGRMIFYNELKHQLGYTKYDTTVKDYPAQYILIESIKEIKEDENKDR